MTLKYKRSTETIFTGIGDDIVALHVERGQCYGMEKVTAAVWAILAEPASLDEICQSLITKYEVDLKDCLVAIEKLLIELQAEGLVEARPDYHC